jgi:hypothetical protein
VQNCFLHHESHQMKAIAWIEPAQVYAEKNYHRICIPKEILLSLQENQQKFCRMQLLILLSCISLRSPTFHRLLSNIQQRNDCCCELLFNEGIWGKCQLWSWWVWSLCWTCVSYLCSRLASHLQWTLDWKNYPIRQCYHTDLQPWTPSTRLSGRPGTVAFVDFASSTGNQTTTLCFDSKVSVSEKNSACQARAATYSQHILGGMIIWCSDNLIWGTCLFGCSEHNYLFCTRNSTFGTGATQETKHCCTGNRPLAPASGPCVSKRTPISLSGWQCPVRSTLDYWQWLPPLRQTAEHVLPNRPSNVEAGGTGVLTKKPWWLRKDTNFRLLSRLTCPHWHWHCLLCYIKAI